ncbi:adenine deaminase [Zhaonella formicivorans]|uniref:adenine deaminase n=1 Tax=Zhaonella formicivorans TaxID=2528593 RepID=UPI001D10DBE7|nr:adenine deaminase [Zhaonella formicivorans]
MVDRIDLVPFSRGKKKPELVLKNARVINVFSAEIYEADVAITGNYIVGIGDYQGEQEVDVAGKLLSPGFIDGHVHIESSMVSPGEFARAVVPHGTTTVIVDPHEIANVAGTAGISYMLQASEGLPLDVYLMLPSCVPATALENSGAKLLAADLAPFLDNPRVLGLGEVMNYPGVLGGDPELQEKLRLCAGKIIDGHAPGLSGKELAAYIAAGITSDHECTTVEEALERLRLGMYIMLREGSATKNLLDLLPLVNKNNSRRFLFVTDDRHPQDLLTEGHIDHLVRLSVQAGIDLVTAVQMASLNAAEYFGLKGRGAIAPGYRADLLVLDTDTLEVEAVYKQGKLVAKNGNALFAVRGEQYPEVMNTVHLAPLTPDKLQIPADSPTARVIELVPHKIVTRAALQEVPVQEGYYQTSSEKDILKMAVMERHKCKGNVGVALVKNFGLKKGAIASSVAHDSHNIVAIGKDDADIILAAEEIVKMQGGIAIACEGMILGSLPLPIGGLMSDRTLAEVRDKLGELHHLAAELGVKDGHDPFMTLAFMSLPVIPELKLTDLGLVDVAQFKVVPVAYR